MTDQIPCQTCGELFAPRTSGGKPQVRCSVKCRRKVSNDNFIKKNAPIKAAMCVECRAPIVHMELGRPRRFCSDACKVRANSRTANRRRRPVVYAERQCVYCGKTFTPKRKDKIHCSSTCVVYAYQDRVAQGAPLRQVEHVVSCSECGTEFTANHPSAKWCSPKCRVRENGRTASRRRGTSRVGDVPYSDRDIFERDNWTCQICFIAVDPAISRRKPEGATIDHVVPIVKGGLDAPANVVLAHSRCNREKWAFDA